MAWDKIPIKLPFLKGIQDILGKIRAAADAVDAGLDVLSKALQVAKLVYLAKADPFLFIFGQLLSALEQLVEDTFNTGIYTLVVDPTKVSAPNVKTINAAFASDVSIVDEDGDPVPPEDIAARALALEEEGLDPELTYEAMRAKAEVKRASWTYDRFGIPLLTPAACIQHMISSLDDEADPDRPVFSDSATVAALGFIVSAPDVDALIDLAKSLSDIIGIDPLVDLLNEFLRRSKRRPPEGTSGGVAPDWTAQFTLADFEFLQEQRDALLAAIAQVRGAVESADKAIVRYIEIIEQKIAALDKLVEKFSRLIARLQAALDAEGIYVFKVDGVGGNSLIKRELLLTTPKAADLLGSKNGYTFGFLMVQGGPNIQAVRLVTSLFLDARAKALRGGTNEKQRVRFSAKPGKDGSSLSIGGVQVSFVASGSPTDPIDLRRSLQVAANSSLAPGGEALVLLSTEEESGVEGSPLPTGIPGQGTKDGLGFSLEWQGADARTPQPLLSFSGPGVPAIQTVTLSEPPTSGSLVLTLPDFPGIPGSQTASSPIPFDATEAEIQEILNDLPGLSSSKPGLLNGIRVSGTLATGLSVSFGTATAGAHVPQAMVAPAPGFPGNSLEGVSGGVSVSASVVDPGRDPDSNLFDSDGRRIAVTVERVTAGAKNDPCE